MANSFELEANDQYTKYNSLTYMENVVYKEQPIESLNEMFNCLLQIQQLTKQKDNFIKKMLWGSGSLLTISLISTVYGLFQYFFKDKIFSCWMAFTLPALLIMVNSIGLENMYKEITVNNTFSTKIFKIFKLFKGFNVPYLKQKNAEQRLNNALNDKNIEYNIILYINNIITSLKKFDRNNSNQLAINYIGTTKDQLIDCFINNDLDKAVTLMNNNLKYWQDNEQYCQEQSKNFKQNIGTPDYYNNYMNKVKNFSHVKQLPFLEEKNNIQFDKNNQDLIDLKSIL